MKKEYFFYTKDTTFVRTEDGKIVPNPIPGPLRQRRQTIRGTIANTGKTNIMQFQRVETVLPDNFSRKYARNEIEWDKKKPITSIQVPDTTDKELVKLFIEKAKTLVIPGPIVKKIVVPEHTIYKKVRSRKFEALAD